MAEGHQEPRNRVVPEDFGGLLGAWADDEHAFMARFEHGELREAIRLTPLNLLQLHRLAGHLIAQGEAKGRITAEHRRQSDALPPMPPAEVDMDVAHRTTGGT